jgi:hypothetical protein
VTTDAFISLTPSLAEQVFDRRNAVERCAILAAEYGIVKLRGLSLVGAMPALDDPGLSVLGIAG